MRRDGYTVLDISGNKFRLHRLIFFYFNGWWPEEVDHINGLLCDNRIENLRASDKYTNQYNMSKPKRNTSGYKGVSWHKKSGKWLVSIRADGHKKYIGVFDDLELAGLVAAESRDKFHGIYSRS